MPVYVHNTAKIHIDKWAKYKEITKNTGQTTHPQGKVVFSHYSLIGPMYHVVNVIELPDANSYGANKDTFHNRDDYASMDLGGLIDECEIRLMQEFSSHRI